jgi:RNA polymerase sigma-70 factor (ECF subfamily)
MEQASTGQVSDAELMRQVQGGDRQAFSGIVERHKDAMVNYLCRLTGCRARAEDMAQETFLRLYLYRERYQEQGKLGALLYRIATNLAHSEGRRQKRQQVLRGILGRGSGESGDTPESDLLRHEAHVQLQQAITQVKLRFRVPLVLHEIEGLSYSEVAEVLSVRENTVKSRISRGRRMLRESLNGYLESPAAAVAVPENGEVQ